MDFVSNSPHLTPPEFVGPPRPRSPSLGIPELTPPSTTGLPSEIMRRHGGGEGVIPQDLLPSIYGHYTDPPLDFRPVRSGLDEVMSSFDLL